MSRRIRLASSRSPYSRGGIAIGAGERPTIVTIAEVGAENLRKLAADPNVEIAVETEDGRWVRLKRAELDLALETAQELTGQRAINPATSIAPIAAPVLGRAPVPGVYAAAAGTGMTSDIVSSTGEALPPTGPMLTESDDDMLTAAGLRPVGSPELGKTLAEEAERERLVEADRIAAEQADADRVEAERVSAERAERERQVEADRVAAEQAEADRIEAERVATEQVEADRIEAERVAAEQAAAGPSPPATKPHRRRS